MYNDKILLQPMGYSYALLFATYVLTRGNFFVHSNQIKKNLHFGLYNATSFKKRQGTNKGNLHFEKNLHSFNLSILLYEKMKRLLKTYAAI